MRTNKAEPFDLFAANQHGFHRRRRRRWRQFWRQWLPRIDLVFMDELLP